MYRLFRRDTADFHHYRSQRCGKEDADHILKLFVFSGLKFSEDPRVKLFFRKGRFQIDESRSSPCFFKASPIWALAERTRGPVIPECVNIISPNPDRESFSVFYGQCDIFQGKSLHSGDILLLRAQGNQRGRKLRHLKAAFSGESVSVPVGTGGRIRKASCSYDHRVAPVKAPVLKIQA